MFICPEHFFRQCRYTFTPSGLNQLGALLSARARATLLVLLALFANSVRCRSDYTHACIRLLPSLKHGCIGAGGASRRAPGAAEAAQPTAELQAELQLGLVQIEDTDFAATISNRPCLLICVLPIARQ